MDKEQLSFVLLKDYASFLLENLLDELTAQDLKRSFELEVPLLKYFKSFSETQLFEVSKKGVKEYLESIINGEAINKVIQGNLNWKADKIPGIARESVVASDIALIYNVRKYSLRHFLPQYTSNLDTVIKILNEVEDYYTFQEELAIQTFAEINQEEIRKREVKLKEAQELAKLGYWEYNQLTGEVLWSDELYHIYGLEKETGLAAEVIRDHIFPDDLPELMAKVTDLYENGGTFVHEYRIRHTDGSTRYVVDKAYVETDHIGQVLVKGISQDITERKVAEGKLQEHDYFMKNLAEIAPYIISVYDTAFQKVIYVNKDTHAMLGYSDDEIKSLGLSIVDLALHPDDIPLVGQLLERVKSLKDMEAEELDYRVKTKTGGWKWFGSRVSPFKRDASGQVTQILSIVSDIDDKKNAIEEIKRKQKLLNEAQEIAHLGSWEWDTTTNEVEWSDELYRLFGYEPGEIKMNYELYLTHLHPDEKEMITTCIYNCFKEGTPYEFNNRIIRKDGTIRWHQAKGQVSQKNDSQITKISGTAIDITEQKHVNDALQQQTEALLASNKELEAFCYTISHDLRSPLRAIDGFGRKLATNYNDHLDTEGQRLLNVVRTNAQQMGVLIDSLLEFSRLNRKEIKKSTVEMQDLVAKVIEELEQQNPDHRAQISHEALHRASGDIDLLKQVWSNLISNAIKFSAKVPQPLIEIGSTKKGGQVTYYIKDNGAGFEMEYKDKLFGVFQRLHSEDEFTGTGVGLATIQRIIHRHGGRVWAEGQPNKGATFYFSLNAPVEVQEPILK